ncbi:MAG: hypothetical protein ACFB12_14235 [Leptolyngbyaceae cyanobacterium]
MWQTYDSPVSNLLNYAPAKFEKAENWPDYGQEFGVTSAHIPELLRLMQDKALLDLEPEEVQQDANWPATLDPELALWGPVYAWRTLGQLQAVALLDGALTILNSASVDWAIEDLMEICPLLGPAALEPLGDLVQAHLATEDYILPLIEGLVKIPKKFPETRDRCVAILQSSLQKFSQNTEDNNSFLISGLQDLKGVEAADVIKAAYEAGAIDEFHVGTWAYTQVELGLKTAADFTEAELTAAMPPEMQQMRELLDRLERQQKPDALSQGLPVDPSAYPSTKPPQFSDIAKSSKSAQKNVSQGFGNSSAAKKKKKKK